MILISESTLKILKSSENLLAFSGGIDSSALFFILQKYNINFDIAIVNYNLRSESILEVEFAKELASKFNKKIYIKTIQNLDLNLTNLEMKARKIRYDFFEEIISDYKYFNLITAHQLNDKLEWFFMQFSKGAGVLELIGFDEVSLNSDKNYSLIRPLINYSKEDLLLFLKEHNLKYFIDNSNFDEKFKRNFIRHNFSDEFLKNYKSGVQKSFEYIEKDKKILISELNKIDEIFPNIFIFKSLNNFRLDIFQIDKILKKLGIIISKKTRDEIQRQKEIVINHKIMKVGISVTSEYVLVFPFVENKSFKIEKKFKEECRKLKITYNLRPYLFQEKIGCSKFYEKIKYYL